MKEPVKFHSSTSVVFAHKDDSLDQAYLLMKSIRSRHLPVLDSSGAVIGMLSDRDFKRAMEVGNVHPYVYEEVPIKFAIEARVKDYMSWPVETIDENSPISLAARLMLEKKISSLVVTRHRLGIGLITTDDLLRVLVDDKNLTYDKLKENLVSAFMNSPVGSFVESLSAAGI